MSNDKTTLADVQPGGRVRLGDALPPLPPMGYKERGTGMGPHDVYYTPVAYTAEQMRDYARAALSAQPSPGGQDALDCIGRIEEAIEFRVPHDIYAAVHGELAELKAALSARQPVGEPVRVSGDMVDGELSVASAIDQVVELFPSADRAALRTLAACFTHHSIYRYAAPPAQAVDLGTGVKAIAAERERQLQAEGFTRNGDQQYRRGELAKAATAYAQLAAMDLEAGTRNHIAWREPAAVWPWAPEWWKPVDARHDLVRAGALIAAQIDLIDSHAAGGQP
ncbi:hypothetical protein I5V61_12375 [Stenotrophomonas maltophilia]|uniref:hypothetical protein n=1 Tax=Stenotrophomonas geniculata TaxID=86188 RepID=UPI0018D34D50|nr:hypothetical protein [Stenotrophomonas maltophilia]